MLVRWLLGSDHVRDLHLRVVDDGGEVVQRHPVPPHDDRVRNQPAVPLHVTANVVLDRDLAGIPRNQKPHHKRPAFRLVLLTLSVGQLQRAADVQKVPLLLLRRFPVRLGHFRRVEVLECLPFGKQAVDGSPVKFGPLGLEVRTVVAPLFRSFIPVQPEPLEGVQNRFESFGDVPLLVGVVDAQHELPTVMPAHSQLNRAVRMPPMCM